MATARRLCVALVLACASADIAAIVIKPTPQLQRGAVVVARPARARLYAVAQTASPLEPSARSPVVAWGVCGFLGIMGSAIGRLTKVAIVPVLQRDLTLLQWSLFGSTMAAFAFFEGYKAFQLKFSPMLVQRAMTLSREGTPLHHIVLAPFYSMGLFHATKKRRIIAWGSAARSTRKPGRRWDSAPCPPPPPPPRLVGLVAARAEAAPACFRGRPWQLGSAPWPQQLASGRPARRGFGVATRLHSPTRPPMPPPAISSGVALMVGLVKRLPYPWRSIVDAGVVAAARRKRRLGGATARRPSNTRPSHLAFSPRPRLGLTRASLRSPSG